MGTRERFRRWVDNVGGRVKAAEILGCHQSYIPQLFPDDGKFPGRLIAHAIERETRRWDGGQIQAEEWDVLELAARAEPSTGTHG